MENKFNLSKFWPRLLFMFVIPQVLYWTFMLNLNEDHLFTKRMLVITFGILYIPFALTRLKTFLKGHSKIFEYTVILPFIGYNFVIIFFGFSMLSSLIMFELSGGLDNVSALLFTVIDVVFTFLTLKYSIGIRFRNNKKNG